MILPARFRSNTFLCLEHRCKICGNLAENRVVTAREMAFGTRDSFDYLECGGCGCVQIIEIPAEMSKYYADGYYSLQPHGKIKTFVRRSWSAHGLGRSNPVGWLFSEAFFAHRSMQAIRRLNPRKDARILDVGCGRGNLLNDLAWLGFSNLSGVDPFLEKDISYENGVKIYKSEVSQVNGLFDLIMLHHSFEHVSDPLSVLQAVSAHLAPGGKAILGIPVASSFAYRHFGTNWCNFDAPRHFFLHTEKSIRLLTAMTELQITEIVHEGNDEQFWLSEQYSKDIAGHDPGSLGSNLVKRLISWPKLRRCRAKAAELNIKKEGDLVCFQLGKSA
jgi:SAM-dependent methyltransferase